MRASIVAILSLILTVTTSAQQRPTAPQANLSQAMRDAKMVEPFKVFDNVYYVGMDWVSAWLVTTSDGLVLIDALYDEFTGPMIENIRKLGFDPADIKYCVATHGHFDHAAGFDQVKAAAPDARFGLIDADWEMYLNRRGGGRYEPIGKDLVIRDGDTITVGETTFTFYQTAGHTLGVLSVMFNARDGDARHKAFVLGGAGLNFGGVEQSTLFVQSMERVKAIPGIEVNLANHPAMCDAFPRAERLKTRQSGDRHPFVDPGGFYAFIDKLLYDGNAKLRLEQDRAAN